MELGVKSTRNAVYQIAYHAVWIPKYRKKVLTGHVADKRYIERTEHVSAATAIMCYRRDWSGR